MPSERTSLILVDKVSKMSLPDVIGDVRANHGLDWMSVLRTAFWKSFGCARNNFVVRFPIESTPEPTRDEQQTKLEFGLAVPSTALGRRWER